MRKDGVARIHRAGIVLELKQLGLELDPKYSHDWFLKRWNANDCEIKTYKINKKIVGFMSNVGGEIMLYVDPEYHRMGIGSSLISSDGDVWVLDGNVMAERFYSKNGFYNTGKSEEIEMFDHKVVKNLWGRYS